MKIVNLKATTKEYFKNQKIIKPESKNCYKKRLMLTNDIANAGLRVG
jgi:hypothetical protein